MNVDELFKRKQPARKPPPGGLTQAQVDFIEQEFLAAIEPLGEKANQFFRNFKVNGKLRCWILPHAEDFRDVPLEKKMYVLKYKDWFVNEISKQVVDDVPWL